MLFTAISLGLVLGTIVYPVFLIIYRLYFHPLSRFPGPKLAAATSWYEAYYDLAVEPGGQFFLRIKELHQQYGPVVRINPHEVHVEDSTWLDTLYCGSSHGIRNKYPPAAHMTGTPNGTFGTLMHSTHRRRRAAISPLFSKGACAASECTIYDNVDRMLERIDHQIRATGSAEMRKIYLAFTTDTLSEHCFGRSTGLLLDDQAAVEWQRTIKAVAILTPLAKQFPWVIPLALKCPLRPLQLIVPDLARIVKARRDLNSQAQEAVKVRSRHSEEPSKKFLKFPNPNRRVDLFDTILSNKSLPDSEKEDDRMAQEGFVAIVAGGETTGRAMAIATYHILANREAVLSRLVKELHDAMPEPDARLPLRDLESLPWLTAVLKESLRMLALVTSRLPLISPDKPLTYGKWSIPAGIPVSMTLRDVLLDPVVFEQPTSFKPERWLSSNPDLQEIMQNYVPFGRGSRMCLGMNLALAELYIAIACLFRRKEFTLHDTTRARDVEIVRDCFIGEASPASRGIRIKYAETMG
ncbi:putative cytochrome P450 [Rosellinia necatrix]|uniref:Putative cytochrome P450 n=1 Tax=Rosellinia necatrix TaxID=77044 RepID=A0A1W2TWV5_ROSNE|nr:putative cytochrome P450 [Rosellinia necatrix]